MAALDCISDADLRAFVLGMLPERVAQAVCRHLESCVPCEAAARRLDDLADPLVAGLQRACRPGPADGAPTTAHTPADTPPGDGEAAGGAEAVLPRQLAGYTLLEEVGRGGMGVVYRAHQMHPAREVAVKVLLAGGHAGAERRARLLAEADAIARLQHPGIVQVYEVGTHDGLPFLALEYVGGGSLARTLGGVPQPTREAAALVEKLAGAIDHAHRAGVVHRDLKPANILLSVSREPGASAPSALAPGWRLNEAVPKITDFGLAKQEGPGLTATGAVLGTPSYMAPEQAGGDPGKVGPAADVYALGAVLYELLTGRPPFQGPTPLETLEQVRSQEPVPPGQLQGKVPRDLGTICLKCLAKEPARRYAGAADLADDLRRFLAGEPIRARPVGRLEKALKWVRRRPALAALWAVGLLAVVLGGAAALWLERQAADLRRGVEADLARVADLHRQERWGEARTALEQTADRLGPDGPPDLVRQVEEAQANLRLVDRLDAARMRAATWVEGGFDHRAAEREYAAAFRAAGLGEPGQDVAVVAARVRESAVRDQLVAALDDWAALTPIRERSRRAWLLAVARRADPGRWRDRFRDPAVWANRAALPRLAAEAPVDRLSPQLLAALGKILERNGADPVPLLTAAQLRHPGDFWLNFNLGLALYEAKKPGDAVGYYRAALAVRPGAGPVLNNLGVALQTMQRLGEAVPCFRRAIALDPGLAPAHANLGLTLDLQDRPEEAVLQYRKALALNPRDPQTNRRLGSLLYRKGRRDEAVPYFRRALALDPRYAHAHYDLGIALQDQGRRDEAIACYRRAMALDPRDAHAPYNLGIALHDQGRLPEAVACYREALARDPRHAHAHNNLGTALKEQGRLDEAAACFRKAIALEPGYAEAHTNLGTTLLAKGRPDEAVACHRKALALDPRLAMAHSHLGDALERQGRTDEAMTCYRKALALDPRLAQAHNNLANVLNQTGRWDEAIVCCRKALALDPRLARAHFNLGNALAQKGRRDEALACFQKAVALDPGDAQARSNLGYVLSWMDRLDEAAAALQKAIALDPRLAPPHHNLGNVRWKQARVDEAIACYQKAVALDPRLAAVFSDLGRALQTRARWEEAGACYQQAVTLAPRDPWLHFNLGRVLGTRGRLDEALAAYRRAIALKPDLAQAHCNLGFVLRQKGALAESLAALRRGHQLGTRQPGWRHPSAQWVQAAERLAQLEQRLPALLRGETRPATPAEGIEYARVCRLKNVPAAADLYAAALSADPHLAGHRYEAARCAAWATARSTGAGQRRRRGQALAWLRADLDGLGGQLQSATPQSRAAVAQRLRQWQGDDDLASVRDAAWIVNLPAEELRACRQFWADVDALLQRAARPK